MILPFVVLKLDVQALFNANLHFDDRGDRWLFLWVDYCKILLFYDLSVCFVNRDSEKVTQSGANTLVCFVLFLDF